jgi:hypothetical protein
MKPKNPAVMRLLPLLLSLISFTAFAQKTVLIQSIQIQNDYDEVAANPFGKPESEAAFLQALEQKLQERLGPVAVEYLNEQKIILMDRAVVSRDPMAAIESFQALHRAKRTFNRAAYDVVLDVHLELRDQFKGKHDNLQIVATVTASDGAKNRLFKNKGRANVSIAPVPFNLGQLNGKSAQVYESFPLSEEQLAQALVRSVVRALDQNEEVGEIAVQRQGLDVYAAFMDQAESYKIIATNDYGQWISKTMLLQFLTYARYRPVKVTRQSDHQDILLGLRERRVTDITYEAGLPKVYQMAKVHKHYRLSTQFGPNQKEHYSLNAVLTEKRALGGLTWNEPIRFRLAAAGKTSAGELTFSVTNDPANPTRRYARSLGRVYHPWASLEGRLGEMPFAMYTNPYALNAVEIKWGGELVGLIVHAAAPRPYLRKRKNKLPYFVYFHPNLDEQQHKLLLQTFQAFHIGQVLQHSKEVRMNQ